MNDFARRLVMDRASNNSGRDRARRGYDRAGRSSSSRQGYRGDGREYTVSYDGRRGVRGTGRYGIGGSMYRGDREARDMRRNRDYRDYNDYDDYDNYDYGYDYDDDNDEMYRDYHEHMKLTNEDMKEWKRKMQNADGSLGEHFDLQKIVNTAERLGIKFDKYNEKELCMTANMLYSDYCEALKSVVPKEKEEIIYTKMAKAFLEDDDAPKGSEKLALYYYAIVCEDEE